MRDSHFPTRCASVSRPSTRDDFDDRGTFHDCLTDYQFRDNMNGIIIIRCDRRDDIRLDRRGRR